MPSWPTKKATATPTRCSREPGALVLTALRPGARLQEHQAAGWVVIQTISGRVRLAGLGQSVDFPGGHLVALEPNVAHDVEALEESIFLVTVAWLGSRDTD